jgi:hypothetical protein
MCSPPKRERFVNARLVGEVANLRDIAVDVRANARERADAMPRAATVKVLDRIDRGAERAVHIAFRVDPCHRRLLLRLSLKDRFAILAGNSVKTNLNHPLQKGRDWSLPVS